jgi:glycosyltransferase involved in cell wall biosynthesis
MLPLLIYTKALKIDADTYHFHDPELLPLAFMLKVTAGKKIVYDVHEDYGQAVRHKSYIPAAARGTLATLTRIAEDLFARKCDGIVTATDEIRKKFSSHKNSVSVRNFPAIANFPEKDGEKKEVNDRFHLIYNGGLTPVNGVAEIVRALGHIDASREVRLTLCGSFPQNKYTEGVKRLHSFKRVDYLGWLEPARMPGVLANSDVGIICYLPKPNHLHAMPNKLFEFMAAGLPIIASDFPLWKMLVEGNQCGICVDPLQPQQIARAIVRIIERPEERKAMAANSRIAAEEKYNWEQECGKLRRFYAEIYQNGQHTNAQE